MVKCSILLLSLLMLASIVFAANSVVLIIDDSGSMEDTLASGERKIDAAKTAANNFLDGVSGADEVALMVYYDCDQIVVEQGYTQGNFASMKAKINALEPDSMTPISCAIKDAAEYAYNHAASGNKKTIILLTDGEETCSSCWGGPEDAASQAHSTYNVNVLNVVGFGITSGSSTAQQLQSVAQAGGGNYYDAQDADELNQALTQAYHDSNGGSCCCPGGFAVLGAIAAILLKFSF